jgi:stage V sporulation protein G
VNITEVRVKLVSDNTERLKAFCSITLDEAFVIRDLKVIDGATGPFVAMPSRKLADRCPKCSSKNHLRAHFCGDCGARLKEDRAPRDSQGRVKLHADVAHPINTACREQIQQVVIEAYQKELDASQQPDYEPQEYDEDLGTSDYDDFISELKESAARRSASRPERGKREHQPPQTAQQPVEATHGPERRPPKEAVRPRSGAVTPAPAREENQPESEPQRSAAPQSDGFASGIL